MAFEEVVGKKTSPRRSAPPIAAVLIPGTSLGAAGGLECELQPKLDSSVDSSDQLMRDTDWLYAPASYGAQGPINIVLPTALKDAAQRTSCPGMYSALGMCSGPLSSGSIDWLYEGYESTDGRAHSPTANSGQVARSGSHSASSLVVVEKTSELRLYE